MTRKQDHQFRPELETLEGRRLPAAGISLSHGVLTITGTDAADTAIVTRAHGRITVNLSGGVNDVETFKKRDVKLIVFDGGAGDDVFMNLSSVRAVANGGPGNNLLIGNEKDTLIGGGGNDTIIGGNGNDQVMEDQRREDRDNEAAENEAADNDAMEDRNHANDNGMDVQDNGDNGMDVQHDGMDNSGDHGGHRGPG
jgi:hypothetical protein